MTARAGERTHRCSNTCSNTSSRPETVPGRQAGTGVSATVSSQRLQRPAAGASFALSPPAVSTDPVPALPRALSPLRRPGYRWLAVSLVLTLTSSGLYLLAVVWQVIELGGGPAALSLVSAGTAVGMLLTTLLGGALADRVPQRRLLLVVAAAELVVTAAVAALSLAGLLQLWQLAAASLLLVLAQGLYYPDYSALVPALLPAVELLAANGL